MVLDAEDEMRFLEARDGDNLVCPFQCDQCHFLNLMGREPLEELASDVRLLKCIRRVILDAFWAREPGTVRGALEEAKRGLAIATQLGFAHSLFGPRGPFPLADTMGMGVAVVIVQRSLARGKYGPNAQYETIRKFRAAASNIFHSSIQGQGAMVMAKDTRKLQVTTCPTYSDFFERFNRGLHKRMGDIVRPNRALSFDILLEILKQVEEDWQEARPRDKLSLALEGAFYTVAFGLALRGEEVPLIELRGIKRHWEQSMQHETPHVVISLLGRFKNDIGECYHLMPLLAETPRGLKPARWVERVLNAYAERNIQSGYMFRNPDGSRLKAKTMEPMFHLRLAVVQRRSPLLISQEVDVEEEYGVSRSFRRGGTSTATNNGASTAVVELNGRWRKEHQSGASRPNITIREHYIDVRLTLNSLLEFSRHL
jgi:hypothetical protein